MKSCESSWQFLEVGVSLFLTESNPLKLRKGQIPEVDGADLRDHESASELASQLCANEHLICIKDRIKAPILKPFCNAIPYHEVALEALNEYGDEQDWSELIFAGEQYIKGLSDSNYISESPNIFSISELNLELMHSKQTKRKTVVAYNL